MPPLLQLQQITLRYGSAPLLEAADLTIEPGERVCLIGRNGAGKTSLMRLITGEEAPNLGEVVRSSGVTMTRLDQEAPSDLKGTVYEVVHSGLRPDRHEEDWETDIRIDSLIEELKVPPNAQFENLSGGLKRRALLAKALAGEPDILLLDEPTNHLDIESVVWLEDFLAKQKFAVFFVTHDRAFLRKLATRIVDLERGKLTSWRCDYETFLERKSAAMDAEEKQWAAFDKKLALEEAWLRQGVKARRTRNEGRVLALKKLRTERAKRREREGLVRIELQEGNESGQKVIEAKNVSFAYEKDGDPIIKNFSATIWKGDKIGILGPNGGGKTTLLKLLLGLLEPTSGEIRQGTNQKVAYLDQMRDAIDGSKTVAWNVAGNAEMVSFQGGSRHIYSYLQDFLFAPDRARMPAKVLSGGERNRLLLARLFLQPANVLVLDEPTNDLDAETLEILEALLVEFSSTLLLVSHDREFLDNVVTGTLVFEGDGLVTDFPGGYSDWLTQRKSIAEHAKPAEVINVTKPEIKPSQAKTEKPRKFLNREQRELDELPGRIEVLEKDHAEMSEDLADPKLFQDRAKWNGIQEKLKELETDIKRSYSRWDELEALKKEITEA